MVFLHTFTLLFLMLATFGFTIKLPFVINNKKLIKLHKVGEWVDDNTNLLFVSTTLVSAWADVIHYWIIL